MRIKKYMHNHDDKGAKTITWMMMLCFLIPIITLSIAAKVSSSWWTTLGAVTVISVYLLCRPKKAGCKHCASEKQEEYTKDIQ